MIRWSPERVAVTIGLGVVMGQRRKNCDATMRSTFCLRLRLVPKKERGFVKSHSQSNRGRCPVRYYHVLLGPPSRKRIFWTCRCTEHFSTTLGKKKKNAVTCQRIAPIGPSDHPHLLRPPLPLIPPCPHLLPTPITFTTTRLSIHHRLAPEKHPHPGRQRGCRLGYLWLHEHVQRKGFKNRHHLLMH